MIEGPVSYSIDGVMVVIHKAEYVEKRRAGVVME